MERMYHPANSWFSDSNWNNHLFMLLDLPRENRMSKEYPSVLGTHRQRNNLTTWATHHHVAYGPLGCQDSLLLSYFLLEGPTALMDDYSTQRNVRLNSEDVVCWESHLTNISPVFFHMKGQTYFIEFLQELNVTMSLQQHRCTDADIQQMN